MSYNIPITLFRDLPVYSGALPPDGVQLVVVEGNNGLYRAGLSSILEGTATVAEGVPAYPGDTLSGELAWEDGAFYVNTESGWEKMAVYSEHWDDIVPGTRFLRVDAPMSLSASEIDNALISLDITEATPSHKGLVYIAESIDDLNKVATAGLVKSYVATFSDRIEEVYTYVQGAATEIAGDLAIVDAALEEIRDIGSSVESAKSYVDDVKDDVDLLASSAASSAGRAEMAAERAEQASGALPGFDEIPTADSRNVVRSGGIKLWGDTSFVPLSHVEDIGTGYSEPHVSDDDRERWDAAAGGTIPDRYMEVLASLADDGAITGPDIKIGVSEDDTIIWARDIGVDGKTALTLTADSLSVVAGDGADITGDTHIEGDLDVSGTVTSGGHAVVTVNDAGAFPTGGSLVDGYAGVADAVEYIATVETSIKDYVAANYSRVPVEGGYAERAGDNTMTGSNVFTGEVMFTGPVSVDGNVLSCGGGLSVDGGDIDLGTGWSINAPDANISTISADLVDIGTGGSLRVDGDTNVVDIGIGGDARIHGTAVVDGTLTVGGDFSVDGITTFGDIIDSDVIIGHGPIGKVRAQADLHIGDPSAPGTIRYNNYTYTVDAGVPTQATGQVELVNPMVPCLITIGDNDPLYIEPERASFSLPRVALAASPVTYASLGAGAGTAASVTVGPSALDPSSSVQDYSKVGTYASINLYYNGEKIYEFPSTYGWTVGSMVYGNKSLCNIWSALDPEQAQAGVTSYALQYMLGASVPVPPRIPEGATVPYFNEVQVSLYARHGGVAGNGFSVSAPGSSIGTPGSLTKTKSIPETHLAGGGGVQEAVCAIGVLRAKDKSTGNYRIINNSDVASFADDARLYFRTGSYIRAYIGSELVIDQSMGSTAKTFTELCTYIPELLSSIMPIEMYPVHQCWSSSKVTTLHCKAVNAGAAGNDLRIEIYTGDTSSLGNYAEYFKIDMFGGADGVDPGTDTDPGSDTTPGHFSGCTIGPSTNEGFYDNGVGIAWLGDGIPWEPETADEDKVVYLLPHIGAGTSPMIDDFRALTTEYSPVFAERLTSSLVSGTTADPASLVYEVDATHGGDIDNGFAAVALDATDSSHSIIQQLSGGSETEQVATRAIGVLLGADRPYATIPLIVSDPDIGWQHTSTLVLVDKTSGSEIELIELPTNITMREFVEAVNSEFGDYVTAYLVPAYDTYSGSNGYTVHCVAVEPGSRANNYSIEIGFAPGFDVRFGYMPLFGGADAYDPGTGSRSTSTSSSDVPVVHPLTPQQIADLISTLPDYTASVHETGSNLVDITAKLPGARFNADTYAAGGVDVVTPVSGGSDNRDAGGLAALLSDVDIFDVRAEVVYPDVIELTAKQAGGYNNDKPIECTGCFGTGTVLMGSKTAGADGVDPTHYNLMLNGERITPGGGGGGSVTLDPIPVSGSTNTAVSSAGVYDATFVRTSGGDAVWAGPGLLAHESDHNIHTTLLDKENWNDAVSAHLALKFTPFGSENREAHYFVLAASNTYRGFLKAISIRGASAGTVHSPFYIGVFEKPEGGSSDPSTWNLMGVSNEPGQEEIGRSHSWDFDSVELAGGRDIAICAMTSPGQGWNTSTPFNVRVGNRPSSDTSSNVDGSAGLVQCTLSTMVMSGEMIVSHTADSSAHLDAFERNLMNNLDAGWLWYPNQTGSVTVAGDSSGNPNGVSIQSTNAYGRIEIQDYGVVITATRNPQWLDASTTSYAFYDILTTKDFNPSSVPALSSRVTAVEGGVAALEANSHNMRTLTFSDKHGTVQVVAYYGATVADFLGVCFPYGFEISGKTWYMMSKNEFDSLATTSGTTKTITSTAGDRVYYNPGATGGNATFRVDTLYNGVQGGVNPAWGVSTSFGSITVSQPAAYALPTPQEAARIRMLEVAANAADDRADRAERVLHNLGNGLLQLSEDDISFAYPGTNNNGAFSLSEGTLSMTGGGGVSAVMLNKAARHFEATTVAGQKFAVMVVCKPGDETGGAGVFIFNPGNNANIFVCDSSAHAINNTSAVSGYTRQASVVAGRLVVDVIDMTDAPQAGTGYTKRVVVKLGSATVLDTYVDAGIGNLSAYTEPRIGVLGSWSGRGSWTLTDCKVSYGANTAKDVPPTPEATLPAVLQHGHVYSVAVTSDTVDLSGKTVEEYAQTQIWLDYTSGEVEWPDNWTWVDNIVPEGDVLQAGKSYIIEVIHTGRVILAKLKYSYDTNG